MSQAQESGILVTSFPRDCQEGQRCYYLQVKVVEFGLNPKLSQCNQVGGGVKYFFSFRKQSLRILAAMTTVQELLKKNRKKQKEKPGTKPNEKTGGQVQGTENPTNLAAALTQLTQDRESSLKFQLPRVMALVKEIQQINQSSIRPQ